MRYESSASPRISIWLLAAAVFASPTLRKMFGATTATSVAMIASTTSSSSRVKPRRGASALGGNDTQDLLDSGQPDAHLLPGIVPQRMPTCTLGQIPELGTRPAPCNGLLCGI